MSSRINWDNTINKEAQGINGEDFGEVQEVSNGHVLVQRGFMNKERFLIPQDLAESFDGAFLKFRISEDELVTRYREDSSSDQAYNKISSYNQGNLVQDMSQEAATATATATTIPLIEEKVAISKTINEEQFKIIKEPVTETKTVEVPLIHEEISIEKRKPVGKESEDTNEWAVTSRETINIPLKREEVEVSKTPYVKEEVLVRKKPETETKKITEQVTTERIVDNTKDNKDQ